MDLVARGSTKYGVRVRNIEDAVPSTLFGVPCSVYCVVVHSRGACAPLGWLTFKRESTTLAIVNNGLFDEGWADKVLEGVNHVRLPDAASRRKLPARP